jgi:hypothetical protein
LQLNSYERIKSVQALRQQLNQVKNKHERIHIDIDVPEKNKDKASKRPRLKTVFAGVSWKKYALIAAAVAVLALAIWGIDKLVNSSEREARRLKDEAEKIERAEGPLSPSACAKYQELATKFPDSTPARELVGKSNDCIIAPIRLEEAKKIEKEKELNHTAAEAFKKVMDSYPGTTFAKQAEAKVNEFERAKKATLQAWAQMKAAAYQSALDETVGLSPDLFRKLADSLLESIKRYGEIDLEAVDPRLVSHIQTSIAVFNRGRSLYLEMEQDGSRIIAINEAELKKYGEQWREYYHKKVLAEVNEMLRRYDERSQAFNKEIKGLETNASTISSNLKERFNSEEFYILIKKEG